MEELSGERNRSLYLEFVEAYNSRDLDRLVQFYAPDGVHHEPFTTPPDFVGREAIRRFNEELLASFPDEIVEPRRVLTDGNFVSAVCHCSGTHRGEFLGMEATGRRFEVDEAVLVAYDPGGLIKDFWVYVDSGAIARQLGYELVRKA